MEDTGTMIPRLIDTHHAKLLISWLACQGRDGGFRPGQMSGSGLTQHSTRFLAGLRHGTDGGQFDDIDAPQWSSTRAIPDEVSQARVAKGFSPSRTATFVYSLKEPLFELLGDEIGADASRLRKEAWIATKLLDKLGLYTVESYQRRREAIISRQTHEMLEPSTPVIHLWDAILALPLIGTLDSARSQVIRENLLTKIIASRAQIAIIDITGMLTAGTLVAQHLLKTISAARLMGAECVGSGIRSQIARTIVHLGLDLTVTSKATMADAFRWRCAVLVSSSRIGPGRLVPFSRLRRIAGPPSAWSGRHQPPAASTKLSNSSESRGLTITAMTPRCCDIDCNGVQNGRQGKLATVELEEPIGAARPGISRSMITQSTWSKSFSARSGLS